MRLEVEVVPMSSLEEGASRHGSRHHCCYAITVRALARHRFLVVPQERGMIETGRKRDEMPRVA